MRCSSDIRKRVISFVKAGGSKRDAARRFGVGEASVYRWVASGKIVAEKPGPKSAHKLDMTSFLQNVAANVPACRPRQRKNDGHMSV